MRSGVRHRRLPARNAHDHVLREHGSALDPDQKRHLRYGRFVQRNGALFPVTARLCIDEPVPARDRALMTPHVPGSGYQRRWTRLRE